jgi:hypothetical protein
MNIALVLQHKLLLGIQHLLQGNAGSVPPTAQVRSHAQVHAARSPRLASVCGAGTGTPVTRQRAHKAMPLRVLHEVESGMPRSSTGRLVISGRMADVCAELD